MMEIKLISCPLCLKPHFNGVEALRTSLINVATTRLSCPVCNELLLGLDKLTIHLFSHVAMHINTTIDGAPVSNVVPAIATTETQPMIVNITIENSNNHKVEPEEEKRDAVDIVPMQCDICNFSFTDETILEMHQKLLHQVPSSEKDQKYNCHLCTKKFKMRGSLMVHLRVAHYGFHSASSSKNESRENSTEIDIPSSPSQVQRNSSKSVTDAAAEKISSKTENKQWECDVCSKLFTTKYFLKKHKRLHTGEMPYFCAQCNKSFTFQQSYHKHMLYHTAEKPHVCGECGRAFKELSTLHNHERIHSGERPFACETCGKCFRQRVSYLVHRRIHTGAMPYKCTACNKSFRYKVSQRSHKCAAHPPGSVVRAPDFLQKLLLIQSSQQPVNVASETQNLVEISPETITGVFTSDVPRQNNLDMEATSGVLSNLLPEPPDFFSMVLSPQLPDVQNLCLSPDNSKESNLSNSSQMYNGNSVNGVLETINEESLKHLLYGNTN